MCYLVLRALLPISCLLQAAIATRFEEGDKVDADSRGKCDNYDIVVSDDDLDLDKLKNIPRLPRDGSEDQRKEYATCLCTSANQLSQGKVESTCKQLMRVVMMGTMGGKAWACGAWSTDSFVRCAPMQAGVLHKIIDDVPEVPLVSQAVSLPNPKQQDLADPKPVQDLAGDAGKCAGESEADVAGKAACICALANGKDLAAQEVTDRCSTLSEQASALASPWFCSLLETKDDLRCRPMITLDKDKDVDDAGLNVINDDDGVEERVQGPVQKISDEEIEEIDNLEEDIDDMEFENDKEQQGNLGTQDVAPTVLGPGMPCRTASLEISQALWYKTVKQESTCKSVRFRAPTLALAGDGSLGKSFTEVDLMCYRSAGNGAGMLAPGGGQGRCFVPSEKRCDPDISPRGGCRVDSECVQTSKYNKKKKLNTIWHVCSK